MSSLQLLFTSDEEMEDLVDRDSTVSIVGFIESVSAPQKVGKNNNTLFKFIVSNGHKKIDVLIWNDNLINKYLKELCSTRIININGGYCKAVSQSKYREQEMKVPFEIIIKENTEITYLGYHNLDKKGENVLQITTFDDIQNLEGLIQISGYIRTKFAIVHNRHGNMTYGLGAITDGRKKLTIQIKKFDSSSLEVGDYIKVIGIVDGRDGLVTVFCENIDQIQLNAEIPALSMDKILRGTRPVKRVRSNE